MQKASISSIGSAMAITYCDLQNVLQLVLIEWSVFVHDLKNFES